MEPPHIETALRGITTVFHTITNVIWSGRKEHLLPVRIHHLPQYIIILAAAGADPKGGGAGEGSRRIHSKFKWQWIMDAAFKGLGFRAHGMCR